MVSGSGVIGVEALGSVGSCEVLSAVSAERPATEAVIAVSSAALAADRQRLQDAEQRRIDRDRQLELSRERELARFD
ncbi:MAG: hypothetical protein ACK56E_07010 [Planctomyces sp.]